MSSNPIREIAALGQSIWYDQVRRSLFTSGELSRMIEEDDLRGVTSNPTIFEKAIGGSTDYNEALAVLAEQGLGVNEIYESLALDDIGRAADLLRPVYDRTGAVDGYISLEVSPTLAHETPLIGHLDPTQSFETVMGRLLDWVAFTPYQNASGDPAVSLPLATDEKGLPLGMMLAAGAGREATLLELAWELEQAAPWARIQG